jgi:hypothetical protein
MSRKVIVRLKGGLGNQLFCYAAARRLSLVNDAELVLDTVSGFEYDHLYQRTYSLGGFNIPARLATPQERMEPLGRIRRMFARKLSASKPLDQRRYIQQVGVDFDPGILALRLQVGTTYFDAFGQSEEYFTDIRELLKEDLKMSAAVNLDTRNTAAFINSTESVALHVRWFDNGLSTNSSNMSLDYYEQAIARLLTKIPTANFLVFTDRPDKVSGMMESLLQKNPFTLVSQTEGQENAATDFWLMRQCRHFIIGNSTFAWWAAWLAEQDRSGTQVFATLRNVNPKHSVTAWGFPGLLPDRWTML